MTGRRWASRYRHWPQPVSWLCIGSGPVKPLKLSCTLFCILSYLQESIGNSEKSNSLSRWMFFGHKLRVWHCITSILQVVRTQRKIGHKGLKEKLKTVFATTQAVNDDWKWFVVAWWCRRHYCLIIRVINNWRLIIHSWMGHQLRCWTILNNTQDIIQKFGLNSWNHSKSIYSVLIFWSSDFFARIHRFSTLKLSSRQRQMIIYVY